MGIAAMLAFPHYYMLIYPVTNVLSFTLIALWFGRSGSRRASLVDGLTGSSSQPWTSR